MGQDVEPTDGFWIKKKEFDRLQESLQEAHETLDAIRNGEVDAVVVNGSNGSQIYSLTGAEQPYRVYIEQMQEGAVTVASDGLILFCNRRFADMAKAPLERMISSEIPQFLAPAAWARVASVVDGESEEVVKEEGVLRCADGSELSIHLTASRLSLSDQHVICLIVTDLSERKTQEELRLAKEVAERANIAKDSFLAALSHELRTPLTPALMAVSNLQHNKSLPASVLGDLAMIRRNIELETRLIDDLLDLTRIANGKLELHEAPLDVHAILGRAVDICRPNIDAKGQTLTLDHAAASTHMTGDAVRLQQVLWNIVRNANKFTPAGGSITITTSNPSSEAIQVAVRDTGIGFQTGSADRFFEAFEQIGREITRQFGGLGLGLAISRSIVAAHGGRIWAESEGMQKGALFVVEIPLRASVVSSLPAAEPDASRNESGGLRILLVEDHEDTRILAQRILEYSGHAVQAAATAGEALEKAAGAQFDVVISDLGLPDESGLDLMRKLRDRHGLRGIAVSGYGMEEDVARSREAGFVRHITKPVDPTRLEELVLEVGRS